MTYNPNDYYFKKAKSENFVARSVYKLQEIDQKYKIIRKNDRVLDLGAAPGSWSQYAAEKVGGNGLVVGIDLTPIDIRLPNAYFFQADMLASDWETDLCQYIEVRPFDVVISDMAPGTTGIRITDQARSYELCQTALIVAVRTLKVGGGFVCKFFDGPDFANFRAELQAVFTKVSILRPQSTRKESKELFFIGTNKKS